VAKRISVFDLGKDASGNFAYLLPANSHVRRMELTANTRKDFIVPVGVRRVIFMYETDANVYVAHEPDPDMNAVPTGDDDNGYMPFINPIGLADLQTNEVLQFISPSDTAIHLILGG